jgi:AcrR family transcriptional regulator
MTGFLLACEYARDCSGLATRIPRPPAADRASPRRRPIQARSRATTAAILEAAARVFAEHGYAAGTTNRIAERAGVSVGSLYEYYPNKDAILVALVEAHFRDVGARVAEQVAAVEGQGLPLATLIGRFVDLMVALHRDDPALHRVLFEEAPRPSRVRRMLLDVERALAAAFERLLRASPEVAVPDTALAAHVVVQIVEGLTHRVVLYARSPATVARVRDEIVRVVVGYLAVPGGSVGVPGDRSPARG